MNINDHVKISFERPLNGSVYYCYYFLAVRTLQLEREWDRDGERTCENKTYNKNEIDCVQFSVP